MRLGLIALMALMIGAEPGPAMAQDCDVSGREGACGVALGYYRIRKPQGFGPHPTVVYLYGSTGNSRQAVESSPFIQAFTSRGYAVVIPIALDVEYADGADSGWHLRHERITNARDEIAFLEQVILDATRRHNIDPNRLLMSGQSRGGFLTWEIACHRPDMAQAFAPHAAGYLGPMPRRCSGPARMLHTHGRRDRIVPLDPDRPIVSGGARMTPLEDSLSILASTAGCDITPVTDRFEGYERKRWSGCASGANVEYLLHNGGHGYPGNWVGVVLDWFEKGGAQMPSTQPPANVGPVGGGTAVFRGVNQGGSAGGRFKRVPQ